MGMVNQEDGRCKYVDEVDVLAVVLVSLNAAAF